MSKTFLFQAIQFSEIVLIQTIQLSISIAFVYTQLNVKTVIFHTIQFSPSTVSMSISNNSVSYTKTILFQAIQFSISTQFTSIWPIDRTMSGDTAPGQSEPWSNGNEGVLLIRQSSSITEASPSEIVLCHIQNTHWRGSYPSAEKQSVFSIAQAYWQNQNQKLAIQ